jgi:hypothetical protein
MIVFDFLPGQGLGTGSQNPNREEGNAQRAGTGSANPL